MNQSTTKMAAPGTETFEEMLGVYEVCVKLGRCSEELLNYLIDMELVALNAEIASAHARQNQEAFSVLSSEAGQVAKRMSTAIAQITARADALTRNSLNGIVQARLSHKLLEVPCRDKAEFHPGSRVALEAGIRRTEELVRRTAIEIDAVLGEITTVLNQILRENKRFETIATYFSIEASRDPDSQAYFANIAQMLRGICAQTRSCIQVMGAQADDTCLTALIRRAPFNWDAA
jgi:hypothetical protein